MPASHSEQSPQEAEAKSAVQAAPVKAALARRAKQIVLLNAREKYGEKGLSYSVYLGNFP